MPARSAPTLRARKRTLPAQLRRDWTSRYQQTSYRDLPWFSPKPYPFVEKTARSDTWRRGARVLDIGCGAGSNSLFLARAGFRVSGIDVAEGAIAAAGERADRAGLKIDFRVADVLDLPYSDGYFGGALDIGCFHTLPVDLRAAYAEEVSRVIHPRRVLALSWVARESRSERGPPHRPSVQEVASTLEDAFLFLRAEYLSSSTGRQVKGAMPVYCALLGRRSFPRPPVR
jgi:SAM-dependent methyltransferase